MKRIISIFFSAVIILSLIITYPSTTYALSEQTPYTNINTTETLKVDDLSFSNIRYVDNSSTSTHSFGLTGTIINETKNDITYVANVYYYDENENLLAKYSDTKTALPGNNTFNQISSIDILKGYSITKVCYYRLEIITNDHSSSINKDTTSITPSKNTLYKSLSYVIDKYDINITVNENNTFDITEKITAHFNIPRHGIFRTIPLRNKVTRLDGTKSSNIAQVTNLSVDNKYSTSRENGNYKIKIGSKNQTLIGEQNYIIKYTYNLGKDPMKNYDELYYNIIGNEWDTVIGNITFTITMPKDFDSSKLGFSSGKKGSTNNSNIKYNIRGNTISGSYEGILAVNEALTVRCELDEGYFTNAGFKTSSTVYLMFIIPILSLLISIFLWYKFGHDNQVIETIEFYPPTGFNSLEVGFLYKGKANNKDVTSLLIYLANKGYIKISETEGKNLFSTSKGFKITKLKEYDGNNINEEIFLNGLFTKKPSLAMVFNSLNRKEMITPDKVNEVTQTDLYNNFYTTMEKILYNINNKDNKRKIFERNTSTKSLMIIFLILISLLTTIIVPTVGYAGVTELQITLIACVIYLPFFAVGIFSKMPLFIRIFWLGFTIFHSSLFFISLPIIDAIRANSIYLVGFIVGVLCVIGMIILLKLMPKRTEYGNEILGKIRGFKTFLETAEKDRLEAMVMQDPSYFYDILPYTYVLGVSDKWIKKFESISLQAPSWYDSPTGFNIVTFGTFMNTTMASAQNVMSSSVSSSSSGSSSGGGSSGGGSGGGGGGSW